MESPAKKRGSILSSFGGFWRSSTAPPADSDASKSTATGTANSSRSSHIESGNASAPESPVKRASDTQLAQRKILNQPRGPSSKLSQSFTAADIERSSPVVPAASVSFDSSLGTPRRRPGDNPYKQSTYSSSTISHTPTNSHRMTNFSGTSTTPRPMFRNSVYQRPGLPTFSPRVPASTLKQSFPPNTPGKAPRRSTPDLGARGLAQGTSSELFEMRIPSPSRELTGEMLTNELKKNAEYASRPGSVYADEFLAHLCPPGLDDAQRRQFFCILDLRRLKYSADEVFLKKDWKINVLNFAKEYEKNRSLIMLRYGLYEFKTVKTSEAVKKQWKQKHGIPDSDDEAEPTAIVKANNIVSKRKAEEDLKSTDTALTSSSSNANKRARAPEAATPAPKNKRKADAVGEPDENQPAKLLKPGATPQKTPSATKSMFESIVNKAPTSTTPAKPPAKSNLFAPSTGSKLPNGNGGKSIFEASSKPSVAATNIFGHLSDASKGSPNDDADAESETDSGEGEGDGEESEAQEVSQSEEPTDDAGDSDAPTPQFGAAKTPATLNGTSTTSSDAGESTQGRSLFDRITRGSDGQPLRQLPGQEGRSPFVVSPERSASPAKELPPAAPANNTWSTATPIKFAPGSSLFGAAATAPKPAAIDFGASTAKKPEAAPAAPAQNLFGGLAKKPEEPAAKVDAAPKAPASSLFGFPAKPAESSAPAAPSSLFGAAKPAEPSTAKPALFGSAPAPASTGAAPAFGQPNKEASKETPAPAPAPATSLFGATPAPAAAEAPKTNVFQSSTLFGSQTKTEAAPQPQAGGLFGKPASTETPAAPAPAPATSLFGQSTAKPLFGAAPASTSTDGDIVAKKITFGSGGDSKPAPSLFGFGSSATPAPAASKPAESKPLFGSASTAIAAPEAKSLFGATPASQPEAPKRLFGGAAPAATAPASSAPIFSFGSTQAPAAPQPTTTQPGGTGSIFGTGGGASFTFSAGGNDASTIKNPFSGGAASAPSSFNFGVGGGSESSQSSATPFTFGASAVAPTISFGASQDTNSQPSQQGNMFSASSTPVFNFGGPSSQPNGPSMFQPPSTTSMFGNSLAPGGGTSTGTNSPFTFGGASSLATTPATGTPEPAPTAGPEDSRGTNADGDEAPQEQISLTDGGPGEEDESVVHEVRAKAVKLVTGGDSEGEDSGSAKDKKKNPWVTQGVGPLRVLKHKATGAVRMLLRAEPRGHIALNKLVLPNFAYKVDPAGGKYVKLTTATDDGKGFETWMLQVKTPDSAKALAQVLEDNKKANEKKP